MIDTDEWEEYVPEPRDMEEAQRLRSELVESVQMIQAQLTDPHLDEVTGERLMTPAEYNSWRVRAKKALAHRHTELRQINDWIANHRREVGVRVDGQALSEMSIEELKGLAYAVTKELVARATAAGEVG